MPEKRSQLGSFQGRSRILKLKLQGVKGCISETDWDHLKQQYGIIKGDWLVKDKEEKRNLRLSN